MADSVDAPGDSQSNIADLEAPLPIKQRLHGYVRRRWWVFVGALAAAGIAAYIARFAPGSHWQLSQNTEDWARFGEYVGGIFGVFAFVGVLITVELQRRQLRQLSDQATVDELHRLSRELTLSIERQLDAAISLDERVVQVLANKFLPRSTRGVLELAADISLPTETAEHASMAEAVYGPSIKRPMDIAGPEFNLLANCLQDAFIRGGSPVIMAYYDDRYGEIVRRMKVLGYTLKSTCYWLRNRPKSE